MGGLLLCSVASTRIQVSNPHTDQPVHHATPAQLEVAITVDDLPAHGDVPAAMTRVEIARGMVAALKARNVPAVYGFSNGQEVSWDPSSLAVLQEWLRLGNVLGNHTFNHTDLAHSTADAYVADIAAMEELLEHVTGAPLPAKVFRYPFLSEGDTLEKRNRVREYLATNHYQIAQVTIDYLDWAWSAAYDRCLVQKDERRMQWLTEHVVEAARWHTRYARKLAHLLVGRDIRHILLLHVSAFNAITLPEVLTMLQAEGARFVDLPTAMNDTIYQVNPNLPLPDGRTFLEQLREARQIEDPYGEEPYSVERFEGICKASPNAARLSHGQ
jgi:peptidoglycan/xylan/chitin deacetylase (PgdA/CDA1 family)